MKNKCIIIILLLLLFSCNENKYGEPNTDFTKIEKSFLDWWNYHNKNIIISGNFIPLDEASKIITKKDFIKLIASGNYIALKLNSNGTQNYYKLFKLDKYADPEISDVIKQSAETEYEHFKMEGKVFPHYDFTDLNGNSYNSNNLKNKTVVLKCWYIRCQQCVAEIPQLNDLVKEYENQKDVVFLSLASDSPGNLYKFLAKKNFKYAVIPNQKKYFDETLKVTTYPTHYIIKNGIIVKVVNNAHELKLALKNEI